MTDDSVGNVALFEKNFNKAVHNIVLQKQIIKSNCFNNETSRAAEEYFFQESIYDLVTSGNMPIIPKYADFPADQVKFTRVSIAPKKWGIESIMDWEDTIISAIDLPARTTARIGNRIARDVDKACYNILTENDTPVNIKTIIGTNWADATRSARLPHEDIGKSINAISNSQLQNFEPDTIIVNPLNYVYLVTNDYVLGSFDASSPAVMKTGVMGTILGLNLLKSSVVTSGKALVLESGTCATWKDVGNGLNSEVIRDPGKSITLRAWQYGNGILTSPTAVCLITGV